MREVTRFNVEQFRKERRESFNGRGTQRAPASVDRELQLLSRIFSLAVERGLMQTNPCKGVKLSGVGRIVTGHRAANAGQDIPRIPVINRAEHSRARCAELKDCEAAAGPKRAE